MIVGQSTSANIIIGPILNISASIMVGLEFDNDAIWLHKNGGASAARSNTTSAASVSPGFYRIVLNSADTNTLGELVIVASGSGAILFRKDVDIWQIPSFNLFYGSADGIATSAVVAGVSGAVAGVSAAVAAVSAAVANVSARVEVVRVEQSADQALLSAQIAGVSTAVANVSTAVGGVSTAVAGVSAAISGRVVQALRDHGLHVLVIGSASANQPTNNSLLGKIMTSASADTYDRLTDSLAAQADVAAAGGVTSAAVSTIISVVVQGIVNGNQIPSSAAVSGIVAGAITNADLATSSDVSAIFAAAGAGLTSAAASTLISVVVQNVITLNDIATSSDVSAIVQAVSMTSASLSTMLNAALVNYDVASSSDVSVLLANSNLATSAAVSADQAALSALIANVSAAVAAVSARVEVVRGEQSVDQGLLSAQIAGLSATVANVSAAVAAVSAAVANVSAAVLTSAETSAIVEQAVFQRALTEPAGAPTWASPAFDVAIEWVLARNLNRQHQASTSTAIFNSANTQIASASVGVFSTSANIDQWT